MSAALGSPRRRAAMLLGFGLAAGAAATAEGATEDDPTVFPPVVDALDGGELDWTHLRLEATARSDRTVGAWKDRRVQEQDALDRLAPKILGLAPGIHVTSDLTAGELLRAGDELALRLQEGLQTWRVEETRYISTGRVEMDAALDLQAWLRPALVAGARAPGAPLPAGGSTGVLVDARGLEFARSLVPSLYPPGEQAPPLFSLASLAEETVRRGPPVVWAADPADPLAFARTGRAPRLARATAVRGEGGLVVDASDAAALAADPQLPALLAAGRLAIVVDR